jgi:Tfp pilus assembly PilM family ATPase
LSEILARRNVICGISISGETAILAGLEQTEAGFFLVQLDELQRSERTPFWYLNLLERFPERDSVAQVALALDGDMLHLLTLPIDSTLSQSDRNDHIHWEFSHYIENYKPGEFIHDVHVLDTDAEQHVERVLAVAVRRNIVFGVQDALRQQKLALGVVDLAQFAADTSLVRNYPEDMQGVCTDIGWNGNRIDVSVLDSGHLTAYRYATPAGETELKNFLTTLDPATAEKIFLHGTGMSPEFENTVKATLRSTVVVADPLRRIPLSPEFPTQSRHLPDTHRYAAAVGIALRRP